MFVAIEMIQGISHFMFVAIEMIQGISHLFE
jgi:hypothetical protein